MAPQHRERDCEEELAGMEVYAVNSFSYFKLRNEK